MRGRSGLLSISGFVCTAHRGLFFGIPAISHQPMVLCKGSPEKCCPAHCFFLIPFFFGTTCIIVSFFGLSSNFLKNIVFFPENSKNLLHAYEMVVPEVASLASVLRTCREQTICLWMARQEEEMSTHGRQRCMRFLPSTTPVIICGAGKQ